MQAMLSRTLPLGSPFRGGEVRPTLAPAATFFCLADRGGRCSLMLACNRCGLADVTCLQARTLHPRAQPVAKTSNHCKGRSFQAWLNDQGLIDYRDDRFAIGRIGLWTKTDSVTAFDEVMVVPLDDN